MDIYGSVEGFLEYHNDRGNCVSGTLDSDAIQKALLVASEWLDGVYGSSWIGYPTAGYAQARLWPRIGAYTNTTPSHVFLDTDVPVQVIEAAYEAAYRHAVTPGVLQKDFTPNKYKSVSISGALSVDYDTRITQASDTQIQIPAIQRLMSMLIDISSQASFSPLSGPTTRV